MSLVVWRNKNGERAGGEKERMREEGRNEDGDCV
jgi:hypothetical protein